MLITAGPTREAIDPVRYISNHSSGKMGIALAEAFAQNGCAVDLILGPTNLSAHHPNVITKHVTSASEMFEAANAVYPCCNIAVFAAAVADYTPKDVAAQKVKKQDGEWTITLVKTKDIAQELGKQKTAHQVNIVFALETENETQHAIKKVQNKNADFCVLNSLRDEGAGFGTDTNKVAFIFSSGKEMPLELDSKQNIATIICAKALELLRTKTNAV